MIKIRTILIVAALLIATNLITGFTAHLSTLNTQKKVVEQIKPVLQQAIDKETIKNEIKNEISIDKIKKSDSLKIIMDPVNNQKPVNIIYSGKDSVLVAIKHLTRKQKKRLGLK